MTLATPARLSLAVVASAVIHTAALLPVKAPSGLYTSPPFPALLNVRLQPDARESLLVAASVATTGASPDEITPVATSPAVPHSASLAAADTASREHAAVQAPSTVQERGGQGRPATRVALPDEVRVFVRRYDTKAEENPDEVMELPSGKYFYFNAPRLKQAAYPLADAAPQYPSQKMNYPHGAVILLLLIDQEGKLEKTSVVCANPAFEESALASIRDMRFSAARDAGGPVKSYMMVEFGYGSGAPCGPLPLTLQAVTNPAATFK